MDIQFRDLKLTLSGGILNLDGKNSHFSPFIFQLIAGEFEIFFRCHRFEYSDFGLAKDPFYRYL